MAVDINNARRDPRVLAIDDIDRIHHHRQTVAHAANAFNLPIPDVDIAVINPACLSRCENGDVLNQHRARIGNFISGAKWCRGAVKRQEQEKQRTDESVQNLPHENSRSA